MRSGLLCSTFAAAALVTASASTQAADMFVPKAPPIYDWTGLYIGGHVGWEIGSVGGVTCDPLSCSIASYQQSISGDLAGGQIWCQSSIPSRRAWS
jgi:high affinity Mn2+ porin